MDLEQLLGSATLLFLATTHNQWAAAWWVVPYQHGGHSILTSVTQFILFLVYAATAGIFLFAGALYLLPRRWLALNPEVATAFPKGAPLPWRFVNRRGRVLWCGLYICGSVLGVALIVGASIEQMVLG